MILLVDPAALLTDVHDLQKSGVDARLLKVAPESLSVHIGGAAREDDPVETVLLNGGLYALH